MTLRAWHKPQATPGKEYRLGASERIAVSAVDPIALSQIRPRDAKVSGFSSTDELIEMLRKESGRKLTARSKVYAHPSPPFVRCATQDTPLCVNTVPIGADEVVAYDGSEELTPSTSRW